MTADLHLATARCESCRITIRLALSDLRNEHHCSLCGPMTVRQEAPLLAARAAMARMDEWRMMREAVGRATGAREISWRVAEEQEACDRYVAARDRAWAAVNEASGHTVDHMIVAWESEHMFGPVRSACCPSAVVRRGHDGHPFTCP